jgi:ABC-type transport system involved in multi-copper enzyme maturation permease subunit
VIYAIAALAAEAAVGVPWLAAKNIDVRLSDGRVQHAIIGTFGVLALYGIVGLGIGALLRNQIVAVVVGIVFLVLIQNIVLAIPGVKHVWPYTPNGGTQAILYTNGDNTANGVHLLSTGGGVLVLLLWAFVPAILGAAFTMNRDIT